MSKEIGFHIIVRNTIKNVYLRDIPIFRGQERWNSIREKAYRFETIEEAKEALESLSTKVYTVSYESVSKDKSDIEKKKLFDVELFFDGESSSSIFWNSEHIFGALEAALTLAKKANDGLKSIIISEKKKEQK